MKSYTTLEQSRKLAEILPVKTADMKFPYFGDGQYGTTALFGEPIEFSGGKDIPCWSLAALIDMLPNGTVLTKSDNGKYFIGGLLYDNPLDACYEMILKLREQKLL